MSWRDPPQEAVVNPVRIRLFFICGMMLSAGAMVLRAREFSVVVYNVENLFDADGVAAYEDLRGDKYTPAHLATKLTNIARVLATVDQGKGPDLILFAEIEADQTPVSTVKNSSAWVEELASRRYTEILAQSPLPPEFSGVSAEHWLLKALYDEGLRGYTIIDGDDHSGLAVKCVIFTRFPARKIRLHPLQNARPIVEVELDVDGYPLFVFNNHWKSGASDVETEMDRRASARTLRSRLDELFAMDANADIIVGGDFNSHYNQNTRYREMRETGINDILGSQGNELAIRGRKDRDLYNLWFELPPEARGSDVFRGEWGTLMHILLSRGLYDQRGVQYEDNSFAVMKIAGLNADSLGLPVRWNAFSATGAGFSDHFPLYARFRTVDDNSTDRWMPLSRPNTDSTSSTRKVDYARVDLLEHALKPAELPPGANLRDGSYTGKIFYVSAPAFVNDKGHVKVVVNDQEYDVFSHQKAIRDDLRNQAKEGKALRFYGELGIYKGNWQFVVQGKEWVK